eukprot:3141821-Amphidinium_carterae.1
MGCSRRGHRAAHNLAKVVPAPSNGFPVALGGRGIIHGSAVLLLGTSACCALFARKGNTDP